MGISDDALDLVLQKWAWAKGEEAAMKKTIEMCKTQVEKAMQERKTEVINTGAYEVKKSQRQTEHVSKKDLPANIWSKYAKTSKFSVLAFKALKGKGAMKSKAKAKAKAKSTAMKKG
ncbi:unnamed protein product [Symbiodinium sp. CCMP2592]|nr:unnamed protein product [Symbiodinium sp. CCMP2592]